MKSFAGLLLKTITLVLLLVIIFSVLITSSISSKKIIVKLSKSYGYEVEFDISSTQWHPYKPSINLTNILVNESIERKELLRLSELQIEFNLLKFFVLQPINRVKAFEGIVSLKSDLTNNDSGSKSQFQGLNSKLYGLNYLNLKNIQLVAIGSKAELEIEEVRFKLYKESDSFFYASLRDLTTEGNIKILATPTFNQSLSLSSKAIVKIDNFNLNKKLFKGWCSFCSSINYLDGSFELLSLDSELSNFYGTLKINSSMFGQEYKFIKGDFHLVDSSQSTLFISSSYFSNQEELKIPDLFLSYTIDGLKITLPTLETSNAFVRKQIEPYGLIKFKDSFNTKIKNFILEIPFGSSPYATGSFSEFNLTTLQRGLSVKGMAGKLVVNSKKALVRINSPSVRVESPLFQDKLVLNNIKIDSYINRKRDSFSVLANQASFLIGSNQLEASFNFNPSILSSLGDFSLSMRAKDMSLLDSKKLIPNLQNTKYIRGWVKENVLSGMLNNLSLLYRGPLDYNFLESTSSFQMNLEAEDAFLLQGPLGLESVKFYSVIDNSELAGKILSSNFLDSEHTADVKIYKDDKKNFLLSLDGELKGPFRTAINLFSDFYPDLVTSNMSSEGNHSTKYRFNSSISNGINLLDDDSYLYINSRLNNGSFHSGQTGLSFNKVYSNIDFNSEEGFKDSSVSFKLNSVPMQFNILSKTNKNDLKTLLSSQVQINLANFLSLSDYAKYFQGSSPFNINISLPSFRKKGIFIRPSILIESSLLGTEIDFLDSFSKKKDENIDLKVDIKNKAYGEQELKFSYGTLARGRLFFKKEDIEGYVITGVKKQSITTIPGQITFTGSLNTFDISNFSIFDSNQNLNSKLVINNLFIKEILTPSATISNTTIGMISEEKDYKISLSNRDFRGVITLGMIKKELDVNLDYLRINQGNGSGNGVFINLFNAIDRPMTISVEEIFINKSLYGNWKSKIVPGKDMLSLTNLEGKYDKWGLKKYNFNSKSELTITKTPFGWKSSLDTMIYSGSPKKALNQIGIEANFSMDTIELFPKISWAGLPWEVNLKEIQGELGLFVEGFIIKDKDVSIESPSNLLRIISIFNVTDTFEKITSLDFTKLYKSGFRADTINGEITLKKNVLEISKPLVFKSGSSEFSWTGNLKTNKEGLYNQINAQVVMTLPLREYLPAYALILGGPITAGIVYVAGKAFKKNLDKLSSGKWTIKGTVKKPVTNFEGWFEN